MRSTVSRLFAIAWSLQVFGCASTRTVSLQSESQTSLPANTSAGRSLDIVGFTTRDGTHQQFQGTVRIDQGICTFAPHSSIRASFTLPDDQIESFEVIETGRNSRTAILMATTAAVLLGIFLTAHIYGE